MWAAQFIKYEKPGTWLNSGGLGTMGFAVPAAMGAKVGRPDATVWAVDGDGCFQMTNQELATCALNDIPIKVAVINNGSLGMVRQWQTLFYEGRYSNTDLHSQADPRLREAGRGLRLRRAACDKAEDVDSTIEAAMAIDDRPVVVDFAVHQDAMVWPMVAGRREQRRHQDRPRHRARVGPRRSDLRPGTRCPCWSRTSPVCWPASPGCSPGASSTSSRSRSGRTELPGVSRMTSS